MSDSPVQTPELLYKQRGFLGIIFSCIVVIILLFFIDIPFIRDIFTPVSTYYPWARENGENVFAQIVVDPPLMGKEFTTKTLSRASRKSEMVRPAHHPEPSWRANIKF